MDFGARARHRSAVTLIALALAQAAGFSAPRSTLPPYSLALSPVASVEVRAVPRALGVRVTPQGGAFTFDSGPLPLGVRPHLTLLPTPRALTPHAPILLGPSRGPTLTLRATAYNSLESQTDDTPFITATGARTRWGIVAVSRDLLGGTLPYGSLIRLRDLGTFYGGRGAGTYDRLLADTVFIVEDTMHQRKTQQLDVWFAEYRDAIHWGVRRIEVDLVRWGRNGPMLETPITFEAPASALAFR
jgi:3D (Asp-Asp-Asp) domain-containing protein